MSSTDAGLRNRIMLLDQASLGPTWLTDTRIATMVAESLHHRDGRVYRLDAFTIMSNHVHTVFKPLLRRPVNSLSAEDVEYYSLASIMHSLKGYTAFQANRMLGREGEFWRMRATIAGFVISPNGNE